jgi:hypothetical protein
LPKAAVVKFVIFQVSPECRRVGRFRVHGRAGRNRVPFKGRIGRKVLSPGTYRIQARAGRHRVVDARLVIVSRRNAGEIESARSADLCASTSGAGASSSHGSGLAIPPTQAQRERASEDKAVSRRSKGSLGVRFSKGAVGAAASIPPWVYALLGVAIALLAVAVLPPRATPGPAAAMFLAQRRALIAAAGTGVLLGAMVAYALY